MSRAKRLPGTFAAFALMTSMALSTQQARAAEPDALVNGFVAAWNSHDAAAFGKLFAADADWVTASGLRLRGRDRIQAYLAEEHATWAKTTRMQVTNVHLRRLNPDTVTVFFEWEITDAAAGSSRRGNNVFVATRSGAGWSIGAGQVARKPAP
jgi:uncharacterized protein (TIGR02246 family)